MPHEHVGIARCSVDIGQKAVQPHNLGGQTRLHFCYDRVKCNCARKVMHGKVQTGAGFEQILNFLVGLGPAKTSAQVRKNDLWHFESKQTGQLPPYQF
ncbi:hypothetical protein D3C86_1866710 [compost metagenome]